MPVGADAHIGPKRPRFRTPTNLCTHLLPAMPANPAHDTTT